MSQYTIASRSRVNDRDPRFSTSERLNNRNSILDPHLSVLQLLERNEVHSEPQEFRNSDIPSPHLLSRSSSEPMGRSISDSWQSIRHTDYSILNLIGETSHQPAGILSSSDTSEDEPDHFLSPSPNEYAFANGAKTVFPEASHAPEGPSLATLQDSVYEHSNVAEDNDNETVTLSLINSSNSFVMPKLSLAQPLRKFSILIVGKPAQRFYRDIPRAYQKMFEVCDAESFKTRDVDQFSAIMVIFTDPKNGQSLLEMVTGRSSNIIAVCQRGQQQQISNLLNRFSKTHHLRLIYHLTVMSDHQDVHRLLRYLYTLSNEIDSEYDTEVGPRKVRKRRKSYKKRETPAAVNRWVIWSISLTVGVGIGYCISCLLSSTMSVRGNTLTLHSSDEIALIEEAPISPHETVLENYFRQLVLAFKKAVKQVSQSFKQCLHGHSLPVLWMQRIGKDWMSEASDTTLPGVTALDLVLI